MDLKDMILVTENDRGTETNMLMTLDDYKSFIAVDDMSELADNLLQLGRTLGKADNFTEYYRAANVTVKEVLSRVQRVKAESLDDAINKAMDMYYAEQIVLGAEDMKGVDFTPISEGQLPSSLKENGGRAR